MKKSKKKKTKDVTRKKSKLSKVYPKKKGTGKRKKIISRNVSRPTSKKSAKISGTKRKIQSRAGKKGNTSKRKKQVKRELSSEAKENKKIRVSKRTKDRFKYKRNFKNKIKSYSRYTANEEYENVEGKKYKFRGNAVIDEENVWERVKWLSELLHDKFFPWKEYSAKTKRGYVYGMGLLLHYQRYTGSELQTQETIFKKNKQGKLVARNHEDNLTVLVFSDLKAIEKDLFDALITRVKKYNSITVILEGRIYRKSYTKKAKFPNTDYGCKT